MKKILIIILFCLTFMSFHDADSQQIKTEVRDTSFLHKELNDSILYLALEYYEVKYPLVVLAQAKLESGDYTSSHCKNRNNFLGLYNSKKKEYFSFEHWSDCLLKYKQLFQTNNLNYSTNEEYIDYLLEIGYATDLLYKDKIIKIVNNIQKVI